MKKFLIKLAAFAVLCVCIDASLGIVFSKLKAKSKGGEIGKIEYIADRMDAPVLVFGSSRASHHYDPRILQDSLGLEVYNCGLDGNGIIFTYGQYLMFKNRYTPKVIIYDISGFDLMKEADNRKYTNYLKINADRPYVAEVVESVDATERWKMLSQAYRYNTHFVKVLIGAKMATFSSIQGYLPIDKVMKYEPESRPTIAKTEYKFDELKLQYWEKLIADCQTNGTKLIFTLSPFYMGQTDLAAYKPLLEMADANNIPVIDHYGDPIISTDKNFFSDSSHMNSKGAETFTKRLASEIKQIL